MLTLLRHRRAIAVLAAGVLFGTFIRPVLAKDAAAGGRSGPPEVYTQMLQCRTMSTDSERLACYDTRMAKLQKAEENAEIVIVEKREMQEAKRGLFGFSLPQVAMFGSTSTDDSVNELVAKVNRAQRYDYSRWRLVLDNGSIWDQIDSEPLAIDPNAGSAIVIKRASMGSYKARIDGQPPVRIRRVQ
ncbi:MAG: hypothetical protein RLZZ84_1039 [Pseudomonadota bacterium]|jgi:hypothetical protein